jgi:N-acetylmuramoyl-L-alanine amidase
LITRQEWGAKPLTAYSNTTAPKNRTGIIIHHSVTGEGTNQKSVESILRGIDDYHRRKGWGGIGYNFAVDHKGRIYEARGRDIIGVHAANHNTLNFGICYIGNTDKHLTIAAVKAIQSLVEELQEAANKKLNVRGHGSVNLTGCPGRRLQARLEAGRFDIPFVKKQYALVLPVDKSYRKLATRLLGLTPSVANLPARIAEAQRLKALNNNAALIAGRKVRVK